ncbi:MAG TPA: DNA mismatch repair endonuclease MutL [Pyrinomonadaceae bacterium]|jgi:DNA mismatch repair protein MutL|nr:DNA mismatch repair endonuclease MutL [Pyrinomonadaceae bacterium]
MSKIRVLSDHVANQIAAGEVVERPASVAKELVENSIDAGARRIEVDVEAGGRRLLRVSDDGSGMTRDDAVLAFERHATSKITSAEDLERISTLGFRGEALASIASVARVELITQQEGESEGTRVSIEGGRMRDVAPSARPAGTTISVRDLFFNVPARRKFLRSEATESFHLTNLVTHYALAHPEISFALTNNGREVLRASAAETLRERAYQIFGAEFLENLLEVGGARDAVARVRGYVSAPRERRTTRDAQYLFVNGRYVRDRLVARALTEGYRTVLPQGAFPAALLFLEVEPEEVDVNVHPAKTEVRFRRAAAVAESVREAVRAALASAGFLRTDASAGSPFGADGFDDAGPTPTDSAGDNAETDVPKATPSSTFGARREEFFPRAEETGARQESIEFGRTPPTDESTWRREPTSDEETFDDARPSAEAPGAIKRDARPAPPAPESRADESVAHSTSTPSSSAHSRGASEAPVSSRAESSKLPPLDSAAGLVREAAAASLSQDIRPLGQLEDSFIVAADAEGLLLIDQHAAHERILFDRYRSLEDSRRVESQNLLVPETFDLTPAQAAAFGEVSGELERLGFSLMRLSGRTVAVRAVPAELPAGEARNLLAEILDAVDAERRGRAGESVRERVAASLACRAAVKVNTPLTEEKMRWLISRLLQTSSPTTCPHGRPVILRLNRRDIERGFQRS